MVLSNDILTNVIGENHERLHQRGQLDDLLSGMIVDAPHTPGPRYIVVALYRAHRKGEGLGRRCDTSCKNLDETMVPPKSIPRVSASSVIPTIHSKFIKKRTQL